MNNEDFMSLVEQQRSADMLQYLMERNDIALHLVLCSSSRNLLSALCRRMLTVESISNKAHEHYQQQRAKAMEAGRSQNIPLQEAYAKMKRITDSSMINLKSMEKLLHTFATDIKHTYADFLPRVVKNQPNPPQGKEIDNRVRSAQSQCELAMLHCTPPPAPFFPTIRKFLDKDLRAFRSDTDAARLYFANYDLLEVLDDENSLAAKGAKGSNVDVFKKLDLGPKPGHGKQWRRCARCSAVMEDVSGHGRAGLTFLLNQQRKCPCGGFWSLMPPGKLVL
jgi:mediator of RNA polymerase II transcription subunit 16